MSAFEFLVFWEGEGYKNHTGACSVVYLLKAKLLFTNRSSFIKWETFMPKLDLISMNSGFLIYWNVKVVNRNNAVHYFDTFDTVNFPSKAFLNIFSYWRVYGIPGAPNWHLAHIWLNQTPKINKNILFLLVWRVKTFKIWPAVPKVCSFTSFGAF